MTQLLKCNVLCAPEIGLLAKLLFSAHLATGSTFDRVSIQPHIVSLARYAVSAAVLGVLLLIRHRKKFLRVVRPDSVMSFTMIAAAGVLTAISGYAFAFAARSRGAHVAVPTFFAVIALLALTPEAVLYLRFPQGSKYLSSMGAIAIMGYFVMPGPSYRSEMSAGFLIAAVSGIACAVRTVIVSRLASKDGSQVPAVRQFWEQGIAGCAMLVIIAFPTAFSAIIMPPYVGITDAALMLCLVHVCTRWASKLHEMLSNGLGRIDLDTASDASAMEFAHSITTIVFLLMRFWDECRLLGLPLSFWQQLYLCLRLSQSTSNLPRMAARLRLDGRRFISAARPLSLLRRRRVFHKTSISS